MQDIDDNFSTPPGPAPMPPAEPPAQKNETGQKINPLTGRSEDMARPAEPRKPLDQRPFEPPKPIPKKPQDWTPINVKTGVFKNKELFQKSRTAFVHKERDDLKSVLPGGHNYGVRDALAKEIANRRGRGLTRKEIKDSIKNVQKKFGLSSMKARQLRHKFGSFK